MAWKKVSRGIVQQITIAGIRIILGSFRCDELARWEKIGEIWIDFFFYSSIYFHYLYWARFTRIFINHHDLLSWKYTFVTGLVRLVCSYFQPWPVFNRRKPRIHSESNKSKTEGAWKRLYLMPPCSCPSFFAAWNVKWNEMKDVFRRRIVSRIQDGYLSGR